MTFLSRASNSSTCGIGNMDSISVETYSMKGLGSEKVESEVDAVMISEPEVSHKSLSNGAVVEMVGLGTVI